MVPLKVPDKRCDFRLELLNEFNKIVPSPFRHFIGHHQRLFVSVKIICFFFLSFQVFITMQKLRKRIVGLNGDADDIERNEFKTERYQEKSNI